MGSIYHALKKLELEKHIELVHVVQTGHRQKAVYQITAQGKDYLQSLIVESLRVSSVQYPTTLYSALCFLNKIPPGDARRDLEKHKKRLDEEYQSLEMGRKSNEDSGEAVPAISQMTIDNMFAIVQQQRQFVDRILGELEGRKE